MLYIYFYPILFVIAIPIFIKYERYFRSAHNVEQEFGRVNTQEDLLRLMKEYEFIRWGYHDNGEYITMRKPYGNVVLMDASSSRLSFQNVNEKPSWNNFIYDNIIELNICVLSKKLNNGVVAIGVGAHRH